MSFIRGTIFPSVADQAGKKYWYFDDPYPQYVQVQRTLATIGSDKIRFRVNTFDPNTFLRSKAYIKVIVNIQKQERNPVGGAVNASNYVVQDKIYKKEGLVLQNSCTNATLRINSHTMNYGDLRYITQKLNMSFAGKKINDNYLSTSGGAYEVLNGTYDEFGDVSAGRTGDDGRETSYAETFRDINVGATNSTFNFTEALSFGPFNHLADYGSGEIAKNSWNLRQSPLIPYVRELELTMQFKDIAANALIYAYGRNNNGGNDRECQLVDVNIVSAELTLIWVKPRDELLSIMPIGVRIQSWMHDHRQFPLGLVVNGANVVSSEDNIYTQQVPSYLLYYASVDKDSASYVCRAVNTDSDNAGADAVISVDVNSVETGMHLLSVGTGASFILRSNTLGGDDILDNRYNSKELYRLTLKNSTSDFLLGETKFRGLVAANHQIATYPSRFYILLGEQELNSFFIRKGQLQVSNVLNFNSTLVASDGYSIAKLIQGGAFNGGDKNYALHIFYIYDRFYIELNRDGSVDSKFDSQFF